MKPLVSICIPTYNGAGYLKEAMASALGQDYPNLEIVVSDDGSQDATVAIVESFQEKTSIPIRIYHHTPSGIGANWNYCVQQAEGEFIKFLFQDDVLYPTCITELVALATEAPYPKLVYCRRDLWSARHTKEAEAFKRLYGSLHTQWDQLTLETGVLPGKVYLKDSKLMTSPMNKIGEPTCVLLHKNIFDQVGYFNESLKQTLDCEFWYRAMKSCSVGFVDKPLVAFRLHPEQASSKNKTQAISDTALLHALYYRHLFWYLHPQSQWKLLKLQHPFFKWLVALKRKLNA